MIWVGVGLAAVGMAWVGLSTVAWGYGMRREDDTTWGLQPPERHSAALKSADVGRDINPAPKPATARARTLE